MICRPSGPALAMALEEGLKSIGAEIIDFGIKTTPQLHYVTCCFNTLGTDKSYGEPTEEGYYKKLANAYRRAVVDITLLCIIYFTHI